MKHYDKLLREDWKQFGLDFNIQLSKTEFEELRALNDKVSMKDVLDIYAPMMRLFNIYFQNHKAKHTQKQAFLGQQSKMVPFIIGISGSVSVGKSTTARLIQTLLQRVYPKLQVTLMTTDGFLYPNQILEERGILNRKGFPESYDMEKLIAFLWTVKMGEGPVNAPVYSHDIYDIIPDMFQTINVPDVLIVEGINVLQVQPNRDVYVSDFFDWSIFVDADPKNIEKWFVQRFELLMDLAKNDPSNFYHQFALMPREESIALAQTVWREINYRNLMDYILPTKSRADFILHKSSDHSIDYVMLKKY